MSAETLAIVVVALTVAGIVLLVLAPWRSLRRDALDDDDYYALMAGEEPPGHDVPEPEPEGDEPGPSAGDVAIP